MRSLRWKLSAAFVLIGLLSVATVALFARTLTRSEFDRLRLEEQQQEFVDEALRYYEFFGSWSGFEDYIADVTDGLRPEARRGRGQGQPRNRPPRPLLGPFALLDSGGRVIASNVPPEMQNRLLDSPDMATVPLAVDGEQIGTVIAFTREPELSQEDNEFLRRISEALLLAALAAALGAMLLGVLLARSLTRPLHELTRAIQAMQDGKLEQAVRVRSRDEIGQLVNAFNQMSSDLAHANHLRRQMTADIAHDLRTPLTVVTGYLEGLRDGTLGATPERFETMHQEAVQLQHLVEDLRTLSLADAGELSLEMKATAPHEFMQDVARSYEPLAQQSTITLHVEADEALPAVSMDPQRMMQVMGNLLTNALRYTPAGGTITLRARQDGDALCLQVHDTGPGIPPEKLPYIFHRFYRADESRSQNGGESGLGLAIAKSIVQAHGGSIHAESAPGQGTTIHICLPLG